MPNWEQFVKKFLEQMGFRDFSVEVDEEHHHGRVFIHEDTMLIKENLPILVENINHLFQLVARRNGGSPIVIDVNNYRKERENLIIELVRASARKAVATKQEIPLPAMNSYERRLAHVELAAHPDVTTESIGKGKGRYVVVRPIETKKENPA